MLETDDYTRQAVALVLAGGRGARLHGLTEGRAKPAMPFAGNLRIIDFPISNCFNSGVRRMGVLTQYHPLELIRHLQHGWGRLRDELGERVDLLPACERSATSEWYEGTADAVRQNLAWLAAHRPRWVLLLSGDHVYRMDYGPLIAWHSQQRAALTVACTEVPLAEASGFGIMRVDGSRVVDFVEKPSRPEARLGGNGVALASMGVYVFDYEYLCACVRDEREDAGRDFGRDVVPRCIDSGQVSAFPMQSTRWPYWRDVGTVDAYWSAHMDLLGEQPVFDLPDPNWPIWSAPCAGAPTRFDCPPGCAPSLVTDSMLAPGCRIVSAVIQRSVVGPDVRVEPAVVDESVILSGSSIGEGSVVRRAIVDQGCRIPPGSVIDGRRAETRVAGLDVTPGGVVLVSARDVALLEEQALSRAEEAA